MYQLKLRSKLNIKNGLFQNSVEKPNSKTRIEM